MTVLVAYAPASEGREALSEGIKEAHLRKSDLLIVNIGRGHHDLEPEEVRGLETRLAEAGLGLTIESSVLSDPGDAVIQIAQDRNVDMIVIGLRHRSMVGKLILGSTVQRILLDATCPVLAVRSDKL
ncbi:MULTISPECIES: universal stress protein [Pseudarthrobacter]|jgi:nucleotide-binding universal stress UspA family protein|uniref:Nucleotide-binding universal stress UspA family protein n=1 Tax=Pseudarthrobacter oxydans TaxID=1671 RepID=A0AAW8NCQ6_PSEOX|nr:MULTISPECIES: universal stress protein [Pseudarthrobacter]MBA4102049.1 universal stress protein [Arthrobacter sp.]MDV2982397.1 universal stress protein [Actinomycetes bacterium ARC8]MDR6793982.1 nucleotide-binding universal stress UspA family protein [Pseudarthrobacter oxydans]MDR7165301.1 nucleotide-binding universal stress UspA family protein [Pseudarthrobacter oxydans]NSX38252.1 universal stress protein [Pseudarthrobacter oxydans]